MWRLLLKGRNSARFISGQRVSAARCILREMVNMEKYDLRVHQGETLKQTLKFCNADGTVRDLTGFLGYSQVRPDPDSDELICSIDVQVNGESGTVVMTLSSESTKAIPAGCYAYDFAMKDPLGMIRYYLGGRFSVLPSVTDVNEE